MTNYLEKGVRLLVTKCFVTVIVPLFLNRSYWKYNIELIKETNLLCDAMGPMNSVYFL